LFLPDKPVLFLLGNLLFKRATADRWPLSHLVGLGFLAAIIPLAPSLWPLGVAALSASSLVLVAAWETLSLRSVATRMPEAGHSG
jgi:low temperature requirement protein LtrA